MTALLRKLALAAALALTACNGASAAPAADLTQAAAEYARTAQSVAAPHAMVVTDAPLATEVGVQILRDGGNAVDAAVATAFALAVVYPEAGNIGGGGYLIARMADGTTGALDFREKAPLAATRNMFLDGDGNLTNRSLVGHLASGVPGSVQGLWEAHLRFGSLPWPELVRPAIALAEDGFVVDARMARWARSNATRFRRFEGSAELFLPAGRPLRAGSSWRNPDLGRVLRRIAEQGPTDFYEGETADLIVAEMERGGGIITHEDLRRYRAVWRAPVEFTYRGHGVLSMPPSSSGGITLAIMANVLNGYPLDRLGWNSEASLHLMIEAMRRAFADRNHFLGDPDFLDIPQELLTSEAYAARLRESIDPARATPSHQVRPGLGEVAESRSTTHFSIVDPMGNAVALTTTINPGSGVTIRGAGILMNNQMDDFAAKPGASNLFGLVQGESNAIAPGKRMLSAMTPTIVIDPAGDVLMITGARGGPRIITAVFQVLSNVLDHGMDVAAAVHAPRVHHQHLPDIIVHERRALAPARVRRLEVLGHALEPAAVVASASAILRSDGVWTAAPDPRTGGSAAGF